LVDIGWDGPQRTKLWRYNLHYFDDLNAEDAGSRRVWHEALLEQWVRDNPPGRGTGWEPYPTSLRIVNWIKWALGGNSLSAECRNSLAIQARWLAHRLETHLLGNHLFANAKALAFAGCYFEGEEAETWLDKGLAILAREIQEQILPDGGQFERSPMYHALVLEDVLDLINLMLTYSGAMPAQYRSMIENWPGTVTRMRRWLAAMCHPDGEIAFFNDAAIGVAPSPVVIEQYARGLGGKEHGASSVGWAKQSVPNISCTLGTSLRSFAKPTLEDIAARKGVTHLSASGYVRVADSDMIALLDVAPVGPDYLPGHAHADTLSFELSLFGKRVLVNSGTSCYGRDAERGRQRGTAAHNTVVVNGEDSSEVWAGFRVGRRACPSINNVTEERQFVEISASHDGYGWLPGRARHHRRWRFEVGSLSIEDKITGGFREAVARFHVHPDVRLDEGWGEHLAVLLLPDGQKAEFVVEGGVLRTEPGTWHPQFGVSVPNACLAIEFQCSVVKTRIRWGVSD